MSKSILTKKKCNSCLKRPGILTICEYCNIHYCFNCIQQEVHKCVNIEVMKDDIRNNLKKKLENEKCVGKKIVCL
jgi:hypothetical protein